MTAAACGRYARLLQRISKGESQGGVYSPRIFLIFSTNTLGEVDDFTR
jgi:hypothetical protein